MKQNINFSLGFEPRISNKSFFVTSDKCKKISKKSKSKKHFLKFFTRNRAPINFPFFPQFPFNIQLLPWKVTSNPNKSKDETKKFPFSEKYDGIRIRLEWIYHFSFSWFAGSDFSSFSFWFAGSDFSFFREMIELFVEVVSLNPLICWLSLENGSCLVVFLFFYWNFV